MLKLYSTYDFYNLNYVDVNGKAYEIDGIMIHDDKKILTSSRWIESRQSHGNTSIKSNTPLIIENVECKIKRQHDFKELAYIIKEMDQTVERIKMRLYLHVSLFNFTFTRFVNSSDYIQEDYEDKEKNVYFHTWVKNLRKESSNQKHLIYEMTDTLKNVRYDINKLEAAVNTLKRNIKKYHAIYEKESIMINDEKLRLQEVKR